MKSRKARRISGRMRSGMGFLLARRAGEKKRRAERGVSSEQRAISEEKASYLEIERRNMRSIFSLVASQHDCEACAAARAWLAALWAPLAVDEADWAAAFAASAELLAAARSALRRETCCLRLSTSACRGFKSWQPANMVNAATAATLIIALFITINPLIGG